MSGYLGPIGQYMGALAAGAYNRLPSLNIYSWLGSGAPVIDEVAREALPPKNEVPAPKPRVSDKTLSAIQMKKPHNLKEAFLAEKAYFDALVKQHDKLKDLPLDASENEHKVMKIAQSALEPLIQDSRSNLQKLHYLMTRAGKD